MTLPRRGVRADLLVLAGAVVVAGAKADARGLQAQPVYCDGVTRLSFDGAIVASVNNKIIYNNIGETPDGTQLRLIVSNTTSFTPSKEPSVYTGISGNIAQIGMHMDPTKGQAGGTCFDFSFEDAETGEAAIINNLIMTFFDLDNVDDEYCHEVLRACENAEYFTSATSQLEISRTDECTELMSTVPGTGNNNPTDAKNLAAGQKAQSVGMHLTTPVSSVNVCFRVAGVCTQTDRELLFSGPSQIDGCQDSTTAQATAVTVLPTTAAPTTAAPATAAPATSAPATAAPTTAAPSVAPATLAPETSSTPTTTSSLDDPNATVDDSSSADPTDATGQASAASTDFGTEGSTAASGAVSSSDSPTTGPDGSDADAGSSGAGAALDSPPASSTTPKGQVTSDTAQQATVEAVPSVADGAGASDSGEFVLPEHDACEDSCFYDGQLETCYGLINTVKTRGVSGMSESMKADGVPCVNAWAVVRDQCSECGRCDLKKACVENLNELAPATPPLVSGGIRMATLVALGMLLVAVSSLSSLVRRRAHANYDDRTPDGSDNENALLNPRV